MSGYGDIFASKLPNDMLHRPKLMPRRLSLVKYVDFPHYSPVQLQSRCLNGLLRKAERTAIGRYYHFDELSKSADPTTAFQAAMPLHSYQQLLDAWWHRELAGEADVSWRGKTPFFALSSGTSEASSKYIPVTTDMQRSMRYGAFRMFSCLPKYKLAPSFFTKEWLMVGGSASLQDLGHSKAGDLSGINASRPPFWMRRYYKPGTAVAKLKDWDARAEAIARMAPDWDIGMLTGIPSWVQLVLERVIDYHQLDHIHQLWPNLKLFVTGGVAFEPYRQSLERLLAKPLIYQDTYLASEGFIAFQARPETHAMRLLLNNGIFFEFIPFDEQHFDENGQPRPGAEVLTIGEVEEGKDYALLLTTCAGAWRYLIGDTVRFTDRARCEIIITGRTKHYLSLCGEHLSVDNMNQAVQSVAVQLGLAIKEYTVCGIQADSHFGHHWYIGCDQAGMDTKLVAQLLDQALKATNDDYGAERGAMLRPPRVSLVPNQCFYDWQRHTGRLNGQSKFPRVMKTAQFKEWQSFVQEKV